MFLCWDDIGADVNKSSRQYKQGTLERYTPLFNACEKDDLDLVRWLIVAGECNIAGLKIPQIYQVV